MLLAFRFLFSSRYDRKDSSSGKTEKRLILTWRRPLSVCKTLNHDTGISACKIQSSKRKKIYEILGWIDLSLRWSTSEKGPPIPYVIVFASLFFFWILYFSISKYPISRLTDATTIPNDFQLIVCRFFPEDKNTFGLKRADLLSAFILNICQICSKKKP